MPVASINRLTRTLDDLRRVGRQLPDRDVPIQFGETAAGRRRYAVAERHSRAVRGDSGRRIRTELIRDRDRPGWVVRTCTGRQDGQGK